MTTTRATLQGNKGECLLQSGGAGALRREGGRARHGAVGGERVHVGRVGREVAGGGGAEGAAVRDAERREAHRGVAHGGGHHELVRLAGDEVAAAEHADGDHPVGAVDVAGVPPGAGGEGGDLGGGVAADADVLRGGAGASAEGRR